MQATVNIDDSFVTAPISKALSRFDHRARAVCFAFAPMAIGSNIKKGQINENTGNRRRGFTGSHLCERLLEEVFCMDNYYTGTKENIARLLSDPGFKPA